MKKKFLISIAFIFCGLQFLFAFTQSEHFHDMAVSDDGEWIVLAGVQEKVSDEIDDEDVLKESIWVVPGKLEWAFPRKLITFKRKGWTFPAICYNKQNDSFIVFHTDYDSENGENGFYEFKIIINEDKSYFSFDTKFTPFSETASGRFYTNQSGIYFVQEIMVGEDYYKNESFHSAFYKITSDGNYVSCQTPDALKDIKLKGMHRDGKDYRPALHPLEDVVTPTDHGFVMEDLNQTDWWYFNCKSEILKRFSSKQAALDYGKKFENQNFIFYFVCGFSVLLILILATLIFVLMKKLSKKSEDKSNLSKKQITKLIYDTQELERANISRDIHDSVIQDIRGIRIESEMLHVNEDSIDRQKKIENIATDCVVKLRNICYNLTPAELTTHMDGDSSRIELVSIIQTLVLQFTERTNIPCKLKVDPSFEYPTFSKDVSLNLFRVIQEALNNIEKHSYATNSFIFLKTENRKMKIFITDDGVGFDTELAKIHSDGLIHFGLQMMKDRMDLIGGKIDFISGNNDGTEIQLEILI